MTNRFELCCHDYDLFRKTSQCERVYCSGNHNPQFSVYFHKINNRFCYCLNREQLGQYWRCVAKDREWFCPRSCGHCEICKEVTHMFSELKDAHFFTLNATIFEDLPYQPIAWRIFSANKSELYIQIAKSKKSLGIITDHGEVCREKKEHLFAYSKPQGTKAHGHMES